MPARLIEGPRQVGGALAIVFGSLLAQPAGFTPGMRTSLLLAAGVAFAAAGCSVLLTTPRQTSAETEPSTGGETPAPDRRDVDPGRGAWMTGWSRAELEGDRRCRAAAKE